MRCRAAVFQIINQHCQLLLNMDRQFDDILQDAIVHTFNVCNFCLQGKEDEAHFPAFAITQHMSTHWMPLNQAMSRAVRK